MRALLLIGLAAGAVALSGCLTIGGSVPAFDPAVLDGATVAILPPETASIDERGTYQSTDLPKEDPTGLAPSAVLMQSLQTALGRTSIAARPAYFSDSLLDAEPSLTTHFRMVRSSLNRRLDSLREEGVTRRIAFRIGPGVDRFGTIAGAPYLLFVRQTVRRSAYRAMPGTMSSDLNFPPELRLDAALVESESGRVVWYNQDTRTLRNASLQDPDVIRGEIERLLHPLAPDRLPRR